MQDRKLKDALPHQGDASEPLPTRHDLDIDMPASHPRKLLLLAPLYQDIVQPAALDRGAPMSTSILFYVQLPEAAITMIDVDRIRAVKESVAHQLHAKRIVGGRFARPASTKGQ